MSIVVRKAPNANSDSASRATLGAATSGTTNNGNTSATAVSTRRLDTRTSSWPANCCVTRAPIHKAMRANPNVAPDASSDDLTLGIEAIHVPSVAPLTTNMRYVARRGSSDMSRC